MFHQNQNKLTKTLAAVWALTLAGATAQATSGQEALAVPAGQSSFQWDFVTSAYYSPQAGQQHYLRGDFEAEKKLNGNGTNGASGREVFFGMIAAPRSLPFGTKIYIPGIGLGEVHDRGGAIKNSRIDIWMGAGDAGLHRALTWGKRAKRCTVYLPGAEIPEAILRKDVRDSFLFKDVKLPDSVLSRLETAQTGERTLKKGFRGDDVQELQKQLQKLGFLKIETPTKYFGGQTEAALVAFQIKNQIVADADAAGAGICGPRTRAALKNLREAPDAEVSPAAPTKPQSVVAAPQKSPVVFAESLTLGAQGAGVQELQASLQKLGFFHGRTTDFYGLQTAQAVFAFQKKHQLVVTENAPGASSVGRAPAL